MIVRPVKGLLYRVAECLSSRLELDPPSLPQARVCLPLRAQMGGDTLACRGGWGGGGAQLRRLDRQSCTLSSNPFTVRPGGRGGGGYASKKQKGGRFDTLFGSFVSCPWLLSKRFEEGNRDGILERLFSRDFLALT